MSEPNSFCPKCGFQLSAENFCPKCGMANTAANVPNNDSAVVPSTAEKPKKYMNKKGIIIGTSAVGAIIAITIVGYSINTYALSNLQFRSSGGENFDFATFSGNLQMEACNPTSYPASFDKYHMQVLYKEKEFATMDIKGGTISPKQSEILDGNVAIDRGMVADLFMQSLADGFSGTQTPAFNQNDMIVNSTIEAKVLGFIPYTETKSNTMTEFQEIMSYQNSDPFSC